MAERKRGLRPLETLKKEERDELYRQVHSDVQSYHYESQTIRLLKKEKKQREIEEQLGEKIKEFKRKNLELEDFSKKLKEDQEKTREHIESRKAIIQNLDHKGTQETEKLKKENQLMQTKESEIRKKQETKHKVQQELEEIERKIEHYSIYKNILEEVVRRSEDYEEISQLISRCRTLKNSVENLSKSYRKLEEETEREKERFFKEMNEVSEDIGVCTGLIHTLENSIEELNTQIAFIQTKQEQQRISRIEHKAQIAKVELSIKNIYNKALQSKLSNKPKPKGEEERKVRFVANDNNKTSFANKDREIEDPDHLVFMLQTIKDRYSDLKRIENEIKGEVITKNSLPQPTLIEEHNSRTKLVKKLTNYKVTETNRTAGSNKEG